jgi:hypothetical protein
MNIDADESRRDAGLVLCDDDSCIALDDPQTADDYVLAYEHWRNHSRLYGCAHGC